MHQNVSFHHLIRCLWCFVSFYFAEATVSQLIVSDLLDIIILSQHYDMICSNSICLANLIKRSYNIHWAAKFERSSHLTSKDNLIILFIVLFFCHHFSLFSAPLFLLFGSSTFIFAGGTERWFHMEIYRKQGYISMINIICVFLRFTCLLFQLLANQNFFHHSLPWLT